MCVCVFLWVRKFAIWNNMVKNRTLNLCMVQEGEIIFPLQHWRRGDVLGTKEKLKLRQIFCSTKQTTKKYKKDS